MFVSYASEDAAEARRLADHLLELGAADVWLDKRKLCGGDDWAERIDEAIGRECTYFMPVLSERADAQDKGVFWREWRTAIERARDVADVFLLPVVIDQNAAGVPARYVRIGRLADTKAFFKRHVLHAPGGEPDEYASDDLRRRFFADRAD